MRKSKLTAITPENIQPRKPKVLVFGPAGVGKTWVSLDFPGVYYIDTEGGADQDEYRVKLKAAGGMYFGPEQGSLDFDTVIAQIEGLATEKHPHKTVVIDSITKLFNTAITDEQVRIADAGKKDEYGASKKPAVRQMARLVRWLNKADMNAIVIAHEKDLWGLSNSGQREAIGKTFDAWEKLEYELHLVLRISKIGAGDNARRYANIGKSRLKGFPEGQRIDWNYDEFANRYGREIIEGDVVQITLASADEVAEVNRLLDTVKVDPGIVEKWLNKAGAETFSEMGSEQIQACITHLKGRLTP